MLLDQPASFCAVVTVPTSNTLNLGHKMTKQAAEDASVRSEHGLEYWNSVDADDNAMLGGVPAVAGFSHLSKVDLQGSRNFLAKLGIGAKTGLRVVDNAMEGGAG